MASTEAKVASSTSEGSNGFTPGTRPRLIATHRAKAAAWMATKTIDPAKRVTARLNRSPAPALASLSRRRCSKAAMFSRKVRFMPEGSSISSQRAEDAPSCTR